MGTHQQVHALPAAQRAVLRPLAAGAEDVGAVAPSGLHVGQAEGPRVLHTVLHLQLVPRPRCGTQEAPPVSRCG